jgi:subtilisin family serine protease
MDHPDLAPNINYDLAMSFVPGEPIDYLLDDVFSHGTHVAGIIAAADNGYGTIGVAPEAEIVPVKVLSEVLGYGEFSWLIEALMYAADIDADIVNMSLGGTIFLDEVPPEEMPEILELYEGVARATQYAHRHGVTLITSAGNSAIDADSENVLILPSDAPWVLDVSATAPIGWAVDPTTDLDVPTFYTNYGERLIDYAAPGGSVEYPGNEFCTVAGVFHYCFVFDLVFSTGSLDDYYWGGGTSQAAPHVSGVAAIIISEFGGSLHPNKVAWLLGYTADDLGDPGKDAFFGQGRVNANNFMMLFP